MLTNLPSITATSVLAVALTLAAPSFADQPSPACLERLRNVQNAPTPADRPDMMAIGDSITNGVTSATIDWARTENSIPALVARALPHTRFTVPAYPHPPADPEMPIVLDLERQLQKAFPALLVSLGRDTQKNIDWWVNHYPALAPGMPVFFDDVSVAQADSRQMMCDTPHIAEHWIAHHPLQSGALGLPNEIATWYYELNERFILNPRLDPAHDHLSQLAQVMVRHPRRLLINIGANDGVWRMAFLGTGPQQTFDDVSLKSDQPYDYAHRPTTVAKEMNDLVANMRLVADFIPRDVEFVYVNNLGPPSRVANLEPNTAWAMGRKVKCPNDPAEPERRAVYFREYEPYLSTERVVPVPWTTVCDMDREVNKVNRSIAAEMRNVLGKRLVIVDMNRLLMQNDGKHLGPGHGIPVVWPTAAGTVRVELDNRVAHPRWGGPGLGSGGLFGYDNMHPSAVGYAMAARRVLQVIADNEGVQPDFAAVDPQAVVDAILANGTPSVLRMGLAEDGNLRTLHWLLTLPFVRAATPPPAARAHATQRSLFSQLLAIVGKAPAPVEKQP